LEFARALRSKALLPDRHFYDPQLFLNYLRQYFNYY
jgi:hypothetical protein